MESGVGDFDIEDPEIRMSSSKDGKKFNDERTQKIGKRGEFNKRCIWRRLGRFARFSIFRFSMSDKVKPVVIKLEAHIKVGRNGK
jgi:muconolactone delta-isomerase